MSIEQKPYDDCNKLSDVLQLWIDSDKDVTWKKIISVIADPPVKNKRLANEIKQSVLTQKNVQYEYVHHEPSTVASICTVDPTVQSLLGKHSSSEQSLYPKRAKVTNTLSGRYYAISTVLLLSRTVVLDM